MNQECFTNIPPLASMVIMSYNHEKYIKEAIEGAFSQTYCPLEIIISDDASEDGTFEIINDMYKSYSGKHKILINKNKQNLGLSRHFNKTFELISGSVRIGAAGDDISSPNRVSAVMNVFSKYKDCVLVVSDVEYFGEISKYQSRAGIPCNQSLSEACICNQLKAGASSAYKTILYSTFGAIAKDCFAEDMAFAFRAALLGKSYSISLPLVRYRAHSNALTNTESNMHALSRLRDFLISGYAQMLVDLKSFCQKKQISPKPYERLLQHQIHLLEHENHQHAAYSFKLKAAYYSMLKTTLTIKRKMKIELERHFT